jgi:hypothetical protein
MTITIFTWLVLNFVENQVTDRFLYIPIGIVLALARIGESAGAGAPAVADAPRVPALARGVAARTVQPRAGATTVSRANRLA